MTRTSVAPPASRNGPCPCGSGQRYKHCHGLGGAAGPAQQGLPAGAPAADAAPWRSQALNALQTGQPQAAERLARLRLAEAPEDAKAWLLLGLSLEATQPQAALDALKHAWECAPTNPECCFELARLQHAMERFADACATLRAGLAYHPEDALLLNNLGLALRRLGDEEQAESAWRQALGVHPGLTQARANLGQLLVETGRHAAALPLLEPLAKELADAHEYWSSLGLAQAALGRVEPAIKAFAQALRIRPNDAKINFNLGTAYLQGQQLERARTCLEAVHRLDPQDAKAELLLLEIAQRLCDWESYHRLIGKLPDWLEQAESLRPSPHAMVTRPVSGPQMLHVARAFGETLGPLAARPARTPPAHARLRLGYVTTTVRTHPMPPSIAEVLERHDRSRVEVTMYSCGPEDGSPYRPRIAAAVEHFADLQHASDDELIARIRADEIDVLIDLDGYTQFSRCAIFRRRPAPIQVNFLGFPSSLGASCYDYALVDRVTAPPEDPACFSERLLYLPHCYFPSDTRRRPAGPLPSRQELGLAGARFVYCAFNSTYKLTPATFALWMRILQRVPDSVLWMQVGEAVARENLSREAATAGVDPKRLVFAGNAPLTEHLARYPAADLFLDTLPCNAHTTCNDALLMGLPVLTCRGDTFVGRVAASHLLAVGLPELVTEDLAAYEVMAVRLAEAPEELVALRARLIEQGPTSPLFDMAAYTRAMEALLLDAYAEYHRAGGAPEVTAARNSWSA